MKRAILMLVALALLLGSGGQARANFILNGSFETTSPTVGSSDTLTVDSGNSTAIPNWTVVGNSGTSIFVVNTNYSEPVKGMTAFNAEDGNNSIDITGPFN